ncbi:hypothetical protein [Rhodococcus sp. B10]|uniref:hypothetical protein n=1 Tax=Rhodococcus sp. B10 TaxID=2695876 RepID=UPI001431F45E|nr:hypothetical protein [Rhodococcus sp. B10]NIL77098.1 hypothetical protein [Rhodococcus sp. B10]
MADMTGLWIKTIQRGDHTQTYYAEFHSNGTAAERHFFPEDHNSGERWGANWIVIHPMKVPHTLYYDVPTEHGLYVSVAREQDGLWIGVEGRLEPGDQREYDSLRAHPLLAQNKLRNPTRVAFVRVGS